MLEYEIVVDTWEGTLEVDEETFHQAGVRGMIIRLNDMDGGHHKDTGFDKQWKEAGEKGFLRMPYFVYNPWVGAKQNIDFLMSIIPETPSIAADVEVVYPGYSKQSYADEIDFFTYLLAKEVDTEKIYTGPWFLPNLAYWPKKYGYWWGRYPKVLYPDNVETWTWEKLKDTLSNLAWTQQYPDIGPIEAWQCSGDRLILPGNAHPLDITVWPGSLESLEAWFGKPAPVPDPLETRLDTVEKKLAVLQLQFNSLKTAQNDLQTAQKTLTNDVDHLLKLTEGIRGLLNN